MRNYFYLAFALFISLLTACGGSSGGGPAGSTIPIGTVTGVGFDGLLINSTISIYDFSSGLKGALLGQTVSDNSGLYTVKLQVESRPILIEATGGYYMEEAGSGFQVKLPDHYKLSAVANYTLGSATNICATSFTNLAAGLAAYEIGKGMEVNKAIDEANNRITTITGVDILATTPKQITDPANAGAGMTPELAYGFLSGAISMWTYNNTPENALAHKVPYTSIDFAQLMYQDIAADGLLDGMGLDSTGKLSQLSYGTTPLTTDTYRLGLGVSLLEMAANVNNKTGLSNVSALPYVRAYIASVDSMFNNKVPISLTSPVVTISAPTTNAVLMQTVQISATATTPALLTSVEFLVDGVVAGTAANLASPSFSDRKSVV